MSQPTPYNRLYNFTDFQTVNPTDPLPATELDAELNAVALTTGQICANLGLIQRDDGALANQSVTPDSLSAGALAMIHQGEYTPRGAWDDAVAYVLGDVVTYNAATYLCIVAHTSVTQFATDLAAGKWLLIANGALTGGGQAVDLFEGNGSTTAFTLSFTYAGNNAAVVFVGGVAQIPGQDFTISGTTITFVAAPPAPAVAGRKNVMVRGTGIEAQLAADLAATSATNAGASATAAANSASAASASQTAAAASQAAAAGSATSAAASATTATNQASTATTQASNASTSAAAAATSQSAAATSATNAAGSATAAAGSASTATTQATTATNQATAAANSATAASNSATAAAGSASTVSGAATTATTQATNASTSATAASTSATNAANSASQASTSASNAAASASSASSSSSSASTSATNAAASATTATTQASAAGASAADALASQNAAATSATNAAAQATNASGSATAAASSASSAAASAAAAAASLDNFDDRYLGPKSANPTVDNDGNALVTGALYYRTTAPIGMKVYDGAQWLEASAAQQASLVTFEYVATAGQTTFSGADANGVTLSYTVGNALVSVNGVRLRLGDDFTATNGTSVVLASAAAAGDEVLIDAFRTFEVANTYTQAQVDALLNAKQNSLGYTPVDKAGDTMTGTLQVPQLNIGSRKQFDLTNLADETSINWDDVTKNSISYALGSGHANAPMQGVNSIVVDLNTEGLGGIHNSGADTRGVQLWFTDTPGSQQGGANGRFTIRSKQGSTWHPWEKVLTTYSFRRSFVRQTSNMVTSTSTYQDIPGVSVSVTPISVDSRFLIFARFGGYWISNGDAKGRIVRNGTSILENQRIAGNTSTQHETCTEVWIDHPNTTSTVTYKLQGGVVTSGNGSMEFGHADNKCSLLIMEFEGA